MQALPELSEPRRTCEQVQHAQAGALATHLRLARQVGL